MKLALFYVSCFLAFVAGHMVNYTAILYSLAYFDSSLLAGLAYGFCFGPPIIFGWVAGAYIDRYSAKKVLLIAQNFFVLGAAGMLLVMLTTPSYSIALLLASSFCVGIGWAFVAPARLASMGQYVSNDKLAQATIVFNLLVMLGFGLAPIVITQIQPSVDWQGVAVLSIAMFIASSLLLLNAPNVHRRLSHEHLIKEWQSCFKTMSRVPVILQLLFAAIVVYLLMGPMQVVLPQIAQGQLGLSPQEKGNYLGLIAFSLIVGGIIAIKFKQLLPIGKSIVVMLMLCGVSIGLIGFVDTVWLNCLVLVFSTILAGIGVSFIVAGLQNYTPIEIRGRVMSIYTIISQVIAAMSGVLAGVLAHGFSASISLYLIGGLFFFLAFILGWKAKHLLAFQRF